jgi:hypothetical protein
MPLFNPKTVTNAYAAYLRDPTESELACATKWAEQAKIDSNGRNESQLEPELKTDIAPHERDDWERWFVARRAEAAALRTRIAAAEINARIYALFGLDADEIAAIEDSLAGQY